jgi:amino acid transporter
LCLPFARSLGMGATLGSGVYVLWGVVAKNIAGPGVVVSFLISGVASILSGLCYAEFGSRVPRAGSAYVYSYVTVGELLAWTTGWQLLLEYIIGASAVAVSWGGNVDNLAGGRLSAAVAGALGTWSVPGLAATPNVLAAAMTIAMSLLVCAGVRESTAVNNALTIVNVTVVVFVCCAGLAFARPANLVPFAPFGAAGILKGAGTVFFSYVGFDVIATSGEEALQPSRNIPASIIVSLLACAAAYISVAGIVTAMVGSAALDTQAPLAAAFAAVGAPWARYLVGVGSVAGLTTSLMTCIFPMPRIIYAICADGLLPGWIGEVWPRFGTPVVATLLCGGLAAAMALIFDIDSLADMSSIGTLMAYTLVAASVLVLRYKDADEREDACAAGAAGAGVGEVGADAGADEGADEGTDEGAALLPPPSAAPPAAPAPSATVAHSATSLLSDDSLCPAYYGAVGEGTGRGGGPWRWRGLRPYAAANAFLSLFTLAIAAASGCSVAYLNTPDMSFGGAVVCALVGAAGLGLAGWAAMQLYYAPSALPRGVDFVAPFCPWLPLTAIAINVYLMASLSPLTWVRFGVWCAVGMAIYFGYGISHSTLERGGGSGDVELQARTRQ